MKEPKTKICSIAHGCGKKKPVSSFSLVKFRTETKGLRYICKDCDHTRVRTRYGAYRRNSKKRGINFNLSKEDFFNCILKPCVFCGFFDKFDQTKKIPYSGIDRLNNEIGYEPNNIVPCCGRCNERKNNLSFLELENLYLTWKKILDEQSPIGSNCIRMK